MDLGPHAVFIWLCYGAVAVVLGMMIVGLWLDGGRQVRALAELEARGIRRGAQAGPDTPES